MTNPSVSSSFTLVLATDNIGKLAELRALAGEVATPCVSARDLGLEIAAETGSSYRENATLKAQAAARATGMWALGDDTGLAIDALGGAPGIHTARYAKSHGGWEAACRHIAQELKLTDALAAPPPAKLHCALALAGPRGELLCVEAVVTGYLRWPPGTAPGLAALFVPDAAQPLLADGIVLHRRLAWQQLVAMWPLRSLA